MIMIDNDDDNANENDKSSENDNYDANMMTMKDMYYVYINHHKPSIEIPDFFPNCPRPP